jgi:hypothetical protein
MKQSMEYDRLILGRDVYTMQLQKLVPLCSLLSVTNKSEKGHTVTLNHSILSDQISMYQFAKINDPQ